MILTYAHLPSSATPFTPPKNKETPYLFWHGHNIRADYGIVVNFEPMKITNQMIEFGYEYGWVLKKNFYIGLDATFNFWIPRSMDLFKQGRERYEGPITFSRWIRAPLGDSALGIILTPILHSHFGYITSKKTLFTIGTMYLWGLMGTLRHPLSDHFFVEGKLGWWLDRRFAKENNSFLDDLYCNVGIGYHF